MFAVWLINLCYLNFILYLEGKCLDEKDKNVDHIINNTFAHVKQTDVEQTKRKHKSKLEDDIYSWYAVKDP